LPVALILVLAFLLLTFTFAVASCLFPVAYCLSLLSCFLFEICNLPFEIPKGLPVAFFSPFSLTPSAYCLLSVLLPVAY